MLKHITVILPNRPLELLKLAEILANAKVNILAYHQALTARGAMVQLICEPHDTALSVIGAEYGFFARESELLGVRVPNTWGQLAKILRIVGEKHLNVTSSYLAMKPDGSAVILLEFERPEEIEIARNAIFPHPDLVIVENIGD